MDIIGTHKIIPLARALLPLLVAKEIRLGTWAENYVKKTILYCCCCYLEIGTYYNVQLSSSTQSRLEIRPQLAILAATHKG